MIGPLPQYRDLHGDDDFPTVHLDRGYDSGKTRDLLEVLGFAGEIAVKGAPAPIQVGRRWPVERTHSWMNGYIAVLDNPFFAVSGADGTFSIKGLPPGDYTLEAIHEEYGTQTMKVTVAAKDTKQVDFTFKAP